MNLKNITLFQQNFKDFTLESEIEKNNNFKNLCDVINSIKDLVVISTYNEKKSYEINFMVLNHAYEVAHNLQTLLLNKFLERVSCGMVYVLDYDLKEVDGQNEWIPNGKMHPLYYIELMETDKAAISEVTDFIKQNINLIIE